MPIEFDEASWWPPKIDARLRHFTLHAVGAPEDLRHVHALNFVLAVFKHEGKTLATVAEWLPGWHRWNYETISGIAAVYSYWPDGQEPPDGKHKKPDGTLCSCCEPRVEKLP